MEAVTSLTGERYEHLRSVVKHLIDCLGERWCADELFEDFHKCSGYAHYTFSGSVSQGLIDKLGRMPTTEEIIILVDDGFSHFGATCMLNGRGFTGRVNTD